MKTNIFDFEIDEVKLEELLNKEFELEDIEGLGQIEQEYVTRTTIFLTCLRYHYDKKLENC